MDVYALIWHPKPFATRSGMFPLVEALGASPVFHDIAWQRIRERSWTLGEGLRRAGEWYSGSTWNALTPFLDEWQFARRIPRGRRSIAHFIWAEFASPNHPRQFRRRGAAVVGTFHCSARRQTQVLGKFRNFHSFDGITLMSRTQVPFFLEHGVPEERLRVILHGVDLQFYRPGPRPRSGERPALTGLLVGATERDHPFLAQVLRALPPGTLELDVLTRGGQEVHYENVPCVRLLDRLDDGQLLQRYQQADLLVMPMMDCTANNVILEAMACGTPVLTNRVGGIPEYVDEGSSFIMEEKDVELWVDTLKRLAADPGALEKRRPAVRRWAERFRWSETVPAYQEVYRKAWGTA